MAFARHVVLAVALYLLAGVVRGDVCTDAAASVFVNEFHYDNSGADVNESIEVALPAGISPSAVSVVLYNGDASSTDYTYSPSPRSLSEATVTAVADNQWQLAVLSYPNGIQNGPRDGIALVATCADNSQKVIQFICYEGIGPTPTSGPLAGQTCTNLPVSEATDAPVTSSLYLTGSGNKAADFTWTQGANTFGGVNTGQTFTAPGGSGGPAPAPTPTPTPTPVPVPAPTPTCDSTNYTHAAAIQGASTAVNSASPLSGSVTTIGIVVGTSFGTFSRNGFWISDPQPDNDPATSDSVFVYVGSKTLPFTPVVKDRVVVTGTVSEFSSNTQIVLSQITKCASDVSIDSFIKELSSLPSEGNISAVLEPLEGSRVRITAPDLRVSENYQLGRYGEFWVSQGDLFTPTQLVSPGPAAIALENSQAYIRLDDGFTNQNPDPEIYPAPQLLPNNTLRTGYKVNSGFEAIVVQISGSSSPYYDLVPVDPSSLTFDPSTSPRSVEAPARAPNTNLRVVATNVLNLFLGPEYPTLRGASNETEYVRQVTKIVNGIASMKPDVFGVIEIFNDNFTSASTVANLTYLLNQKLGAGTYAYIDPGYDRVGSDNITCKILYQPSVVEPIGTLAVLNNSVDPTYQDIQRPTQAQSFRQKSTGANFTFVIAHLKSKGSDCNALGDPDKGDGQGNCAGVRQAAAAAIVAWLAKNPTGIDDPDILLMGDLNSYAMEDSITTLTSAGYTNLIKQFVGDNAYSYVFDGRRGYLDHALASPSMTSQVVGVAEWHINAAEPNVFDYNLEFKTPNQGVVYYTPEPIRYSDHDPLIVDLKLTAPVIPDPEPTPLAAPTLSAVTSVKKGKVVVTLIDNSKDEKAWRLQYASDAGFGEIAKADKEKSSSGAGTGDAVQITTSGLKGGRTYYVRAFACSSNSGPPTNTGACGPASNAVSITVAK